MHIAADIWPEYFEIPQQVMDDRGVPEVVPVVHERDVVPYPVYFDPLFVDPSVDRQCVGFGKSPGVDLYVVTAPVLFIREAAHVDLATSV